jgi:hypothetical protein
MSEGRLHRDYIGLHRLDRRDAPVDPGGIESSLPISEWIALFARTRFEGVGYLELRAPASQQGNPFESPWEWAKRWPYEHVWKLRRRQPELARERARD